MTLLEYEAAVQKELCLYGGLHYIADRDAETNDIIRLRLSLNMGNGPEIEVPEGAMP